MGDLRTRLTLDGSDFTRGMDDAAKSVDDFTDASKMSASELLKQMKSMENLGRSTSNYRSQLAQMTKQIQDLTINYRAMSDEMKNSDFGKAVAAKIQEITIKASEMKDTIMDASNSVKLLASDTAKLDAAKQGIQGISAAFSLVASSGILGANSTEKMVKVMARLKTIESATNAVITIANVLNKDSILMLTIKNAQTKLATKATLEYTAATGAATVAQRVFNTVAKANPYILLATAILTAVGAMTLFSSKAEDTTYDMAEYETEAVRMRKQNEKLADSYSKTAGTMVSKFEMMKAKWKELSTQMEKDEFIKDNADNFKELGLKIDDAAAAEKAFTEQSAVIIKAFNLRAEAAAYAAEATLQYQEAIRAEKLASNTRFKAGDEIPESWSESDRQFYSDWAQPDKNGKYYFADNADLLSMANTKYAMDALTARREAEEYQAKSIELENKGNDLLREQGLLLDENNNKRNNSNRSGKTQKENETITEGSLKYWQKQVTDITEKLNNMDPNNPEFKKWTESLIIAQNKVKEIQDLMKAQDKPIQLIPPTTGVTLKQAEEELARIKKLMEETDPMSLSFFPLKASYELWTKKLEEIKRLMGEVNDETKETVKINPYKFLKSGLADINNFHSAVSGIYDNVKSLAKAFEECEDPIESLFTVIDNIFSILNNVITVAETLNKIEQISTAIQIAKNAAKKKETQETAKQAILNATNLSTEEAEAIAATVKAAAEGGSSASKIPYVGWAIAIGAIAAIIAAIATAKSSIGFAYGGIVPGASYGGDHVAAQLNSGEMVLNTQQQRNLFSMLNNGASSTTGGEVKFTIEGQQLVGVLSNYNKKMNKI